MTTPDNITDLFQDDVGTAYIQQRGTYAKALRDDHLLKLKNGTITFDELVDIVENDMEVFDIAPLKVLKLYEIIGAMLNIPRHQAERLLRSHNVDASMTLGGLMGTRDSLIAVQSIAMGTTVADRALEIEDIPPSYPWNGNFLSILIELGYDAWPAEVQDLITRNRLTRLKNRETSNT